jgi:hypothetical protein
MNLEETTTKSPRIGALRRFAGWSLAGAAAGLAAAVVVLRALNYDPTPPLDQAVLGAARHKWQSAGPADYDVQISVTGPQSAVYRAEVRGGQAQAAWRNGQPLAQRRTFGTWSVKGMFETMGRDVDSVERHAAGRAPPGTPELILRAAFDEQFGYPQRYRRIEWGSRRGSDAITVTWEVVEFRVRE